MGQYTVIYNRIDVIGRIWLPDVEAAYTYSPRADEVADMLLPNGEINREAVWSWLDRHAGDFQVVHDFRADLGTHPVSDWDNPDSEFVFADATNPEA